MKVIKHENLKLLIPPVADFPTLVNDYLERTNGYDPEARIK